MQVDSECDVFLAGLAWCQHNAADRSAHQRKPTEQGQQGASALLEDVSRRCVRASLFSVPQLELLDQHEQVGQPRRNCRQDGQRCHVLYDVLFEHL